jgi:hypothetical protein
MKQSLDRAIGKVTIPSLREGDWPGKTLDPVGEYLAALLGKSQIYDSRTHVLRGNYGSSLYKKQPVSRDGEYNSLFGRLNYHEGDAYLCYAHIGGGN